MTKVKSGERRILAIAPSIKNVGFAVLDGTDTLADWGLKTIKGNRNAKSLSVVGKLIETHNPDVLVFENVEAKGARRSLRIRDLLKQVEAMAVDRQLPVRKVARQKVMDELVHEGERTKQGVAEAMAHRFPQQLATQLPDKRKAWESENYQMPMFDAVALALALRSKS